MAASEAASFTTIADLPDECLREVVLWIPMQDKIHLRIVCKTWCRVIDDCWSAMKTVKFIEPTEQKHGMFGFPDRIIVATSSRKMHEGVIEHCGRFLACLRDGRKKPEVSILQFAAKHCCNIKILVITVSTKADDKYVNQLLAVNQKLKVLKLNIEFKNAKMCLRTISTDHLAVLSIESNGKNILPPSILMSQKQIFRKANSLRTFHSYFVDEELINIIGKKIRLQKLGLTYHGNSSNKITFHPILNLKNLQHLRIGESSMFIHSIAHERPLPMTDDFLVTLSDNLQLLEVLSVDASYITDKGFVHLSSLPQLRILKVMFCQGVTDKFLYLFARLKELTLVGCNIRDDGVIELLGKTQTMQYLNVSATFITNKTLIAAIKETKKRNNGVVLKLGVSMTYTIPSTITESSPLLEIIH